MKHVTRLGGRGLSKKMAQWDMGGRGPAKETLFQQMHSINLYGVTTQFYQLFLGSCPSR